MAQVAVASADYVPPPLSDKQMAVLEKVIWDSRDVVDTVRPLLVWMLRQTDNLTRRVALTLWEQESPDDMLRRANSDNPKELTPPQVFQGSVHNINSSAGSTHIHRVLEALGTEMFFSHSTGGYCCDGQQHRYMNTAPGCTVWIASDHYDHSAQLLNPPSTEVLSAVCPPP